jgi:hypothetical protein
MLSSGLNAWEHTTNAHTILAEKQSGKSYMQYWGCLPHNWDEMT